MFNNDNCLNPQYCSHQPNLECFTFAYVDINQRNAAVSMPSLSQRQLPSKLVDL